MYVYMRGGIGGGDAMSVYISVYIFTHPHVYKVGIFAYAHEYIYIDVCKYTNFMHICIHAYMHIYQFHQLCAHTYICQLCIPIPPTLCTYVYMSTMHIYQVNECIHLLYMNVYIYSVHTHVLICF